jgi:cytochrome b561
MELFRLLVIGTLLAILFSLGSALFHMTRSQGDSGPMLRALTWRVALSVGLFVLLIVAARLGWVDPHGFGR